MGGRGVAACSKLTQMSPHPSPLTPHPSPRTPHPAPTIPAPLTPHPTPVTRHPRLQPLGLACGVVHAELLELLVELAWLGLG